MKAAVRSIYGSPDVIHLQETDIPSPKSNEVLVRVYATTVNRTDCAILSGKPWISRFFTGLFRPAIPITGTDFAGKIMSAGKKVRSFKTGDRVMGFGGMGIASHAEYLALGEDKIITTIPGNTTYEEAAASMEGAIYALSSMIDKVHPKAGQRALVNGASGAIGSAAVQLLKYFGVHVTAVCDTKNIALIKSLGADQVVDFSLEDFTKSEERCHFIFDTVGKSSFSKCSPLLLPGGIYISSDPGPKWENAYLPLTTSIAGNKKVFFAIPFHMRRSLFLIRYLIEQGRFRPVIDRRYNLENIADAYRYVASGQKTGNVVISLEGSSDYP
ncbi:MAG TPA: NAD(P)-dependent alcohol dehydrogenase [Puia sp.]|nr:NAD(P)-dependent alcohol dehydrogenase [Puia sp.]